MISKQLALQYEGTIDCESESGVGSKFTAKLRLQAKEEEEEEELKLDEIDVNKAKN